MASLPAGDDPRGDAEPIPPAVHEAAAASAGDAAPGDGRVRWRDVVWEPVFDGTATAPFYFMRSGLIRKDLLPLYARAFVPETFVVKTVDDAVKVVVTAHREGGAWVVKKAASSNANGLAFVMVGGHPVPDEDAVRSAVVEAMGPRPPPPPEEATAEGRPPSDAKPSRTPTWVLQRCIRPATVCGGYKFHLRLLVLAVGSLRLFTHANVRLIRATLPFVWGDWSNLYAHATNRTINKSHPDYDAAKQYASMWSLPLEPAAAMWGGMRTAVRGVFRAAGAKRRHLFLLPNCYEVFGFDFMVSDEGRVMLLEVNPDPGRGMFEVCAGCGEGDLPPAGALSLDGGVEVEEAGGSLTAPPPGCLTVPAIPPGLDPRAEDLGLPVGFVGL